MRQRVEVGECLKPILGGNVARNKKRHVIGETDEETQFQGPT
jgi:hypothetical protein